MGLALFASVSHSPSYNLPILLYGWYTVSTERSTALEIRQFLALLVTSFFLDVIWFYAWSAERVGTIAWLLIVVNFLLKPVTLLAGLGNLRQRGQSAFGDAENGGFGGLPGSGGGPGESRLPACIHRGLSSDMLAVWTMPGFSSDAAPPPGPSSHSHQHQSSHITTPSSAPAQPAAPRSSRAGTGASASTTYQAFDADAQEVDVDGKRFTGGAGAPGGPKGPGSATTTSGGTTEGYHSIE